MFRGQMLRQGWTLKQYWRRIEGYKLADIILAIDPESARQNFKDDAQAVMPFSPVPMGNLQDAPGVRIE